MTRLAAIFVIAWLGAYIALGLGARALRWLVDRGTARRDHAAYRRRVAEEWRGRYGGGRP